MTKVQAEKTEGVGLVLPERHPAHAEDNWYQRDLDELITDPDTEPVDPLPTLRHRQLPQED